MEKTYKSEGLVFGNYWGGGKGAYPARNIEASTKKELLIKANQMLEDGSLDSGMGYESLIGALLLITETTITNIKGKEFHHEEYDEKFIGKLTKKNKQFLIQCMDIL
jgi:hypothetical protein